MAAQIPDGRKRAIAIAAFSVACVVGIVLVALALWVALRPKPASEGKQVRIDEVPEASSSVGPTGAPSPEGEGGTQAPPAEAPGENLSPFGRSATIAFRLGNTIYTAAEDGSSATALVPSEAGPFSLSPDGATLALIDQGTLRLVDVASGVGKKVGPARDAVAVWTPDSGSVFFFRDRNDDDGVEVWRVGAGGGKPSKVAAGSAVTISPDGRVVAVLRSAETGTPGDEAVFVSVKNGKFRRVGVSGSPTAVATDGTTVYVALTDADGSRPRIVTVGVSGGEARQLVGAPAAIIDRTVAYGHLLLSPDGRYLIFSAESDDGFSRMYSTKTAGGSPMPLSSRRDGYPKGFNAAGDSFFFVEGNAFQGEPTALWRARPDGTRRVMVVSGAE